MRVIVNRSAIETSDPFYLDALQDYLRVEPDEDQDANLRQCALAASREVEQFAQLALLTQEIQVTLFDPDFGTGFELPIGPVDNDEAVTVAINGATFEAFQVIVGQRPYLRWTDDVSAVSASVVSIHCQAGFGDDVSNIPIDLQQAILDQAAMHYDSRGPLDARTITTSPHLARIGARYRGVRV